MITKLLTACKALVASLSALWPQLPAVAGRASEVSGLACAAVFLHHVWPPLVWAAAAVVLILAGQRR
jgi:hypothetical protein